MGTGDLPPPQISIWGHRRVLFPTKKKQRRQLPSLFCSIGLQGGFLMVRIVGDGDGGDLLPVPHQAGHDHKPLPVTGAIGPGAGGQGQDFIGGVDVHIVGEAAAALGL